MIIVGLIALGGWILLSVPTALFAGRSIRLCAEREAERMMIGELEV